MQNDRPAKWRWCQICQHCRKLWWASYIETAAEMLPKDGSSKVAWPLRPCNVCLFFTWRRATMKIEGFLMVVCWLLPTAYAPIRVGVRYGKRYLGTGTGTWELTRYRYRYWIFPKYLGTGTGTLTKYMYSGTGTGTLYAGLTKNQTCAVKSYH